MTHAKLIDTTRCIGCRACQVACKQWNNLLAEKTVFRPDKGGYQNPPDLSARTLSMVTFNEITDQEGRLRWVFAKRQCMHCLDPACASACIVGAITRTPEGAVVYDREKCIGCRYCMLACPFGVPSFEWDKTIPYIRKCTLCYERRVNATPPKEYNHEPLDQRSSRSFLKTQKIPACAKACPTGAICFGEREELLAEAKARISARPGSYLDHVYGEFEAGGTGVLYLASVPFEKLGFPAFLGARSYPSYTRLAKDSVPPLILGLGGVLAGIYWWRERGEKNASDEEAGRE